MSSRTAGHPGGHPARPTLGPDRGRGSGGKPNVKVGGDPVNQLHEGEKGGHVRHNRLDDGHLPHGVERILTVQVEQAQDKPSHKSRQTAWRRNWGPLDTLTPRCSGASERRVPLQRATVQRLIGRCNISVVDRWTAMGRSLPLGFRSASKRHSRKRRRQGSLMRLCLSALSIHWITPSGRRTA